MQNNGVSHLKVVNTSQSYIYKYENLKRKVYNCNTNIDRNRTYLQSCVCIKFLAIFLAHIQHNGDVSLESWSSVVTIDNVRSKQHKV
jgi:hypothetical protein